MEIMEMRDMPAAVRAARAHDMDSIERKTTVSKAIDVEIPATHEAATLTAMPTSGTCIWSQYSADRSPSEQPTRQRAVFAAARRQIPASAQKANEDARGRSDGSTVEEQSEGLTAQSLGLSLLREAVLMHIT